MLEKMDAFFDSRLPMYDWHMLNEIEDARDFYPFTAAQLPAGESRVLDLGCGTGLELEEYFRLAPCADVTGIDLAPGMLAALRAKCPGKRLTLMQGSYFDLPLGENAYDAAVSVESLHHFTQEQKSALYARLCRALKPGGFFILTDYFAESPEAERFYFAELARLRAEQGIADDDFYHYDTPLLVEHEADALHRGGFYEVEVLKRWGATVCLRASKRDM